MGKDSELTAVVRCKGVANRRGLEDNHSRANKPMEREGNAITLLDLFETMAVCAGRGNCDGVVIVNDQEKIESGDGYS